MIILKRIILMIQFLTTIPLRINLVVDNRDFGKGLIFAPLIGALIGGALAAFYYLLQLAGFTAAVNAVLVIILYILLTGGLHLDGLGDTFDGLFSNRSKERILEIMRDSRVGTNAVLAIGCVLLLNTFLIAGAESNMYILLLLMPVSGRIGSLVGAGVSCYARSGEGLGKSFIEYCGKIEIFIGIALCIPVYFIADGIPGILKLAVAVVSSFVLVKIFSKKIGGATGDILGAVCELNQTVYLLTAVLLSGIWI